MARKPRPAAFKPNSVDEDEESYDATPPPPDPKIKVKQLKTITVDVTKIGHHDGPIMLPNDLTTDMAIAALQRRKQYDEYGQQDFTINAEWDCFIYEGAYALNAVLTEQFGWATAETVHRKSMFGEWDEPPTMLNVPIDEGVVQQVPWGRFRVPGIDGFIECSIKHVGGSMFTPGKSLFRLTGQVKRNDEPKVKAIVEGISARLATSRIYRNKVFSLQVKDEGGDWMEEPTITFLPLNTAMEQELVLSASIREAVEVNLFTPIEQTDACRALSIPLKRGILLAGQYGTGKTMIGHVAAIKAKAHGWTYIVADGTSDLADIIRIARQYEPCIVFHEDIDRIVTDEHRTVPIDHVLNVIDGVESKTAEVMIVMTTNDVDSINPALMRPGRLDAVITVQPPDAVAAERLVRQYARGLVADADVLTESPALLAGKISAVIREIVERTKLAAITHATPGEPLKVTDAALVRSAKEMDDHIKAATPRPEDKRSERVKAAAVLAEAINSYSPSGIVAAAHLVLEDHAFPHIDYTKGWPESEQVDKEMEGIEANPSSNHTRLG